MVLKGAPPPAACVLVCRVLVCCLLALCQGLVRSDSAPRPAPPHPWPTRDCVLAGVPRLSELHAQLAEANERLREQRNSNSSRRFVLDKARRDSAMLSPRDSRVVHVL